MEKLKEWWNKLSTQEKIALGVLVAGVVGYALYKRSKNSSSSSSSATPGSNTGIPVDAYGNQLYPTNLGGVYSASPNGTYTVGTGTGTGTGASTTQTGTVRQAISGSSYDKQYGGVYTFKTPATAAGGGTGDVVVPFGSQIQILGTAIGTPYGGTSGGGSNLYYLTPEGYISAQDVTIG